MQGSKASDEEGNRRIIYQLRNVTNNQPTLRNSTFMTRRLGVKSLGSLQCRIFWVEL
jgi:hypothetical protein